MKLGDWLKKSTAQLTAIGISSARLDSLIIIETVTGRDRAWILAHPETKLTGPQLNELEKMLERRADHEPIAYIRGFSEFYGRRFLVNRRVLEPRPESEAMIDALLGLPLGPSPKLADIGTGSGCLGITAKLEIPDAEVDLYDIDINALAVARHNCELHEVYLRTYKRDLLGRPVRDYHVILANLPYVPSHWMTSPSIKMEPKLAIDGGEDGLVHYRRLFRQLSNRELKPQFVLTEALPPQHAELARIGEKFGYEPLKQQGFIQVFASPAAA